ncbi:MAG TPA: hypothetical protein ENK56_10325 [Chloroflexi bacterium]|nr:hypothetical protein [Chloroflexota bacterium]
MAECIVCRGEYTPGRRCERCGSDNTAWERWRRGQPEEQGGARGLLAFTAHHLHIPLLLVLLFLGFGLVGIGSLWQGLRLEVQFFSVLVTIGLSIASIQVVYTGRRAIWRQYFLSQVRTKLAVNDVKLWSGLLPALWLLGSLLLVLVVARCNLLWKLACWFVFEPGFCAPVGDDLRSRLVSSLPLFLASAYVGLGISLTYWSSLIVGLHYVSEMRKQLPFPLPVQSERMAQAIRWEVEQYLRRPIDGWSWEEVERTPDGGVVLKAREGLPVEMEEETGAGILQNQAVATVYIVRTDPWGRIRKIDKETKTT